MRKHSSGLSVSCIEPLLRKGIGWLEASDSRRWLQRQRPLWRSSSQLENDDNDGASCTRHGAHLELNTPPPRATDPLRPRRPVCPCRATGPTRGVDSSLECLCISSRLPCARNARGRGAQLAALAALSAEVQRALQCSSPGGESSVRLPGGRTATLPTATLSALRPLIERAYRSADQREDRAEITAMHVNVELSLGIARMFPLVGGAISAIELARQRTVTGRPLDAMGNVMAVLSIAGDLAQIGRIGRMGIKGARARARRR
jgi:hypothetical protein